MSNFISDDDMSNLEKSGKAERMLKQLQPSDFISDDEMEGLSPKSSSAKTSAGGAFLESFGNSASMGYLPHLQALVEKALPNPTAEADAKLKAMGIEVPEEPSYVELRDENIKRHNLQREEHPIAAGAGTVGGIVAGGAGASAVLPAVKGATLGARALSAAKTGATLGAVANPGDAEGELSPLQMDQRIDNAKTGAITGAVVQGGVEVGGKVLGSAGKYVKRKAEERAFKALGPDLRAVRQNMSKDRINEIGRQLLDDDIVTSGASTDEIFDRIVKAKQAKGQKLESIIEELGQAEVKINSGSQPGIVPKGVKAQGARAGIDRKAIAQSMREELINPNLDIPGVAKKNAQVEKLIREFENGGDDLMGLLNTEKMKRSVGKEIKWDRLPGADIPIEEQVQRALYTRLKQGAEDGAEALETLVGGPNAGNFRNTKKGFGNLQEAENIAQKKQAKDLANRFISPSDYLTGGLGAATGFASGDSIEGRLKNAALGASLGLVNKATRGYGNQVSARTLDKVGSLLAQSPKMAELAKSKPKEFQSLVSRLTQKISGEGSAIAPQGNPIFNNPMIMEHFEKNPGLIEQVQDENLRNQLKSRFGIASAGSADQSPKGGPDRWAHDGAKKLGIQDAELASRLMQSKQGKQLLIEASSLPEGSRALQRIKDQIEKGISNESSTSSKAKVLRPEREPASRR